jgi:hypothetical protein
MRLVRLRRLAATVALTVAVGSAALVAGAPLAGAATCADAQGVSVVVDFKQLGGGVRSTCIADGAGQRASALFPAAGFDLTYVQNEPGFVCRVDQQPAPQDEPCVDTPPSTAYWGLWWSDGKSGSWAYSNYGVSGLKVPAGGYVALAWKQGEASASPPSTPATAHSAASPTPSPTPSAAAPTKKPGGSSPSASSKPSTSPGSGASTAGPTPSLTTSPATGPSTSPTASPSGASPTEPADATGVASAETSGSTPSQSAADPTEGPVDTTPVESASVAAPDGSLPGWVPFLVIALLIAAAAAIGVRRRARSAR